MDIYGYPVSLTYKALSHYKTTIGGIATIIGRASVLSYFLIQLSYVASNLTTITNTTFFRDLSTDFTTYVLDNQTFDYAFLISSVSGNQTLIDNLQLYIHTYIS